MNRSKRQLTSILLTLAMIVTMIPVFTVTSTALAGYAADLSELDFGDAKPGYYI